jgi:parallel beta-helix repeat protein
MRTKRTALALFLVVALSTSLLLCENGIQPVESQSDGTIYIRAGGSVEGTDQIQRVGNVYTFTGNINASIVVEKDDIVIEGAGYALRGSGSGIGIELKGRSNVKITNVEIKGFNIAIAVNGGSDNVIFGNSIKNNDYGVKVDSYSVRNTLSANNITNNGEGIRIAPYSDSNSISGNSISDNGEGIVVQGSGYNTFFGNSISNNERGITFALLGRGRMNNRVYHNNFVNNTRQILFPFNAMINADSAILDNGFPSGGNYWSNYEDRYPNAEERNGSGVWDTPYVIDEDNRDNYPLMFHWGAPIVSIVSPRNTTYTENNVSLKFAVSKPAFWMGYSLDGQDNVTITGNTTLPELSSGLHSITVYAKDSFENMGNSETTYFSVEVPFPTTLVTVASVATVAVVGVGLLVYFRKRSRRAEKRFVKKS